MRANYPNIELIEHIFLEQLNSEPEYRKRASAYKKNHGFFCPDVSVQIFPQLWGSTCTGFDITDDGAATIGGCAMTESYTTVTWERHTDIYGVFFGNLPCYIVTDPTQAFYEDLNNRQMTSKSEAKTRYDSKTKSKENIECERY